MCSSTAVQPKPQQQHPQLPKASKPAFTLRFNAGSCPHSDVVRTIIQFEIVPHIAPRLLGGELVFKALSPLCESYESLACIATLQKSHQETS